MTPNDVLANALRKFRDGDPTKAWTWNGKTIYGSTSAISDSEVIDYLPDGGRNATDIDPRAVSFSPGDLPNRTGPIAGDVVIRGATGISYRVVRGYLTDGQAAWRCIMYKVPAAGTSTSDADQLAKWS